VGETRGVGLIGALEIVRDKRSRAPFTPASGFGTRLQAIAADHGIIVRAIRDAIALCPPLIIQPSQIDELFDRLQETLDASLPVAQSLGLTD
jgi:4-aminobutyrate--pyruvate transaminase